MYVKAVNGEFTPTKDTKGPVWPVAINISNEVTEEPPLLEVGKLLISIVIFVSSLEAVTSTGAGGASGTEASIVEAIGLSVPPIELKTLTYILNLFPTPTAEIVSWFRVGLFLTLGSASIKLPSSPSSMNIAYPEIAHPPLLAGGFHCIVMVVFVVSVTIGWAKPLGASHTSNETTALHPPFPLKLYALTLVLYVAPEMRPEDKK